MLRPGLFLSALLLSTVSVACAQSPLNTQPTSKVPAPEAIDNVLQHNVLTYNGQPFHAAMSISEEKNDSAYGAQIEIFWVSEQKYRLSLTSSDFAQTLIVNGSNTQETDRGDFYPNWLHSFVLALLDPMPRRKSMQDIPPLGLGTPFMPCLRRDDRPNGITDQVTWANICFSGDGKTLAFVDDFTYNMEFHDFKGFGKKQIARTYISGEADRARLHGTLTLLEEIKQVDESLFTVEHPTPPDQQILTTLVSTQREESMVASAPQDVIWPPVHEGKLDGYMIVQAITDRTGQVREISRHNSDNGELESFGREVALKYKFKPLVVDGVPRQMAMPLVLHFTTKIGVPIPDLPDAQSRKLISGCDLPRAIADPASAGQQIELIIYVTADGHFQTAGSSDRKILPPVLFGMFRSCRFSIYKQEGQAIPYHAHLTVTAK